MESKTLIYGGVSIPAVLRTGEQVPVKLRLIKISEIPRYLDLSLDEAKALAFCIDDSRFVPAVTVDEKGRITVNEKALEFIDTLSDESYLELVARNNDLNFTRALEMSDQRLKRAEASGVGLAQIAGSLVSLLNRFSPKSESPAASAASSSSK